MFFFLQQIIQGKVHGAPMWKTAADLGLEMRWDYEWSSYTYGLSSTGVCFSEEGDSLFWGGIKATGGLSAKGIYTTLIKKTDWLITDTSFKKYWSVKVKNKMIIFTWLVWRNKI